MSDPSDKKKASIPEWQRKISESSPEKPSPQATPDDKSEESSSPPLLDQAARFLEDESIRDAPTDKKVAFLESKGVKDEDIQKLLGSSQNTEASAKGEETSSTTSKPSGSETKTAQPSQSQPASSSPPQPAPPTRSTPSTRARSDAPPIITYPEFLVKSPKPPPLITFRGVLYTLYGAAGLATGIYGLSQYVVTPLLESLSDARHDLAETAQQNLQTLNEKLEKTVSTIPPVAPRTKPKSEEEEDEESSDSDETDSAASDPTELFHRDIATQTTPDLDPSSANTTLTSTAPADEQKDCEEEHLKAVKAHHLRLRMISSHLDEFVNMENEASNSTVAGSNFDNRLSELQTYLNSLTYSAPSYMNSTLYGGYGGDAGTADGKAGDTGKSTGIAKAEEDAITSFKTDIRGVKGALLSARNFPGKGVRAR